MLSCDVNVRHEYCFVRGWVKIFNGGDLHLKQQTAKVSWILAVDLGLKKTGLAVGQTFTKTAQPLTVLKLPLAQLTATHLSSYIREWRVNAIVFGKPVLQDGQPHPLEVHLQRLKHECEKMYQLPVFFSDEYLSSHEAKQRNPKLKQLDSLAAAVIAEDWLAENFN